MLGLSAGPPVPPPERPREAGPAAAPPLAVPVYGPIDRAVPSDVFAHDIPVREPDTNQINFVVRRGFNYPAGSFPAEPGRVPVYVDARTAVCYSLSPVAAYRCLRGGGYF